MILCLFKSTKPQKLHFSLKISLIQIKNDKTFHKFNEKFAFSSIILKNQQKTNKISLNNFLINHSLSNKTRIFLHTLHIFSMQPKIKNIYKKQHKKLNRILLQKIVFDDDKSYCYAEIIFCLFYTRLHFVQKLSWNIEKVLRLEENR